MKLLIGASSSKIFHLKEFSKKLEEHDVKVKVVLDVDYEAGKSYFVVSESAVGGAVLSIWEHTGTDWATNWESSKVAAGQANISVTWFDETSEEEVTYTATYNNGSRTTSVLTEV